MLRRKPVNIDIMLFDVAVVFIFGISILKAEIFFLEDCCLNEKEKKKKRRYLYWPIC